MRLLEDQWPFTRTQEKQVVQLDGGRGSQATEVRREPHLDGDTTRSLCSRRTPTPAGCPGDLTPTTARAA